MDIERSESRKLIGILPYQGRDAQVLTLIYERTVKIGPHIISEVEREYVSGTPDDFKDIIAGKPEVIAQGFSVALKSALAPVAELLRCIDLKKDI